MAIVVATGFNRRRLSWSCHGVRRATWMASAATDAAVGAVLETDRARQTAELAVALAFGVVRAPIAPHHQVADELRAQQIEKFVPTGGPSTSSSSWRAISTSLMASCRPGAGR
jgi:hypothetical protein